MFLPEEEARAPEKVRFFDTTLRDGEQTPGVSLTIDEKVEIARQLDSLGVDVVEAGFPSSSKGEMDSVARVAELGLGAEVCALARCVDRDIDAAIDADVDLVHVFISTSDVQMEHALKMSREEVMDAAVAGIERVKDAGLTCLFSAMDATRTDEDFLVEIVEAAEEAGADTFNVPDTVGIATPALMHRIVSSVRSATDLPLDVHCHNDFNLAVANSVTSVSAGAQQVQVAVNGIGERAGNADLASVAMVLGALMDVDHSIETEELYETSRLVERLTGVQVPVNMPVVGDNVFSHESGIHSHGVIEESQTFEPGVMTPEMVGHRRRLVLGKHVGRHAVEELLGRAGLEPTDEQVSEITERVKDLGDKGKRVTGADLYAIAGAVMGGLPEEEKVLELVDLAVMTGNRIAPTASVKAVVEGDELVASATGVGPVDAAIKAVQSIMNGFPEITLTSYRLEAITGGSDAVAEVLVEVENPEGDQAAAGSASEDIVIASVEALVTAVNRILAMGTDREE
ncbi:MAG: 2-isopropylmalate synthase [Methanonatronarchaeales archaeon]|nr:2-isopropylmalate synthase [Methanonatronarchaeales archaeon]